ncbi:MAG: family 10 glycosylhydrolase [Lentisphaeria bacterium]|nr:family 10 glycosylhydrolase [Lentisphaeria bacterium]
MKHRLAAVAVSSVLLAGLVPAQDGVLDVRGIGAEGKPPYAGGKVEFLGLALSDQLVHLGAGEGIPLRLEIRYRVLETAPVLLNSRFGTEYWQLHLYDADTPAAVHTREPIDLSRPGEAVARVEMATPDARYGPPLAKGLAGIRGHRYFLVDRADGEWLDVVHPPPFFSRPEHARELVFTLADLRTFRVEIAAIESTWQPGGILRVRVQVRDADGDTFAVVGAGTTVTAGEENIPLRTQVDGLGFPTGWVSGALPEGREIPARVTVRSAVRAMTPEGPVVREVSREFARGEGMRTPGDLVQAAAGIDLPRGADGLVRETRALWVNPRAFLTREGVEGVVERAAAAGLNVIVPDIFLRSMLVARSERFPMHADVEEGLDPLAHMIAKAHAAGIEVHPWFCVMYRDPAFHAHFPGVGVVDREGKTVPNPADVHRPEYRDFVVGLMADMARTYAVDGIHLDYIRAMEPCYCPKCREEFAERFGKPLAEATAEEWTAWQREAVGDIVRRTAAEVRRVRPDAIVSAAVFANLESGARQGQDPEGWVAKGWLDLVIPMDYKMDTLGVRATEKQFLAMLERKEALVSGLCLYARSGTAVSPRPAELVRDQIQTVRGLGIHGYCLFEFSYLDDPIRRLLGGEINAEKAVPYFRGPDAGR